MKKTQKIILTAKERGCYTDTKQNQQLIFENLLIGIKNRTNCSVSASSTTRRCP